MGRYAVAMHGNNEAFGPPSRSHERRVHFSQIRQIIFDLVLCEFPEPRTYCAVDTLVAEQMVCGLAHNANLNRVAIHFALDGLF